MTNPHASPEITMFTIAAIAALFATGVGGCREEPAPAATHIATPANAIESAAPVRDPWSEAAAYSRAHGGEVLLVMRDGKTVFEDAIEGWDMNRPHPLASGTKSFTGVAAMIAVQQGIISLDERVSDTITEWQSDPRKRDITVRELLNLSSGLQPDSPDDRKRIRSIASGGAGERIRSALTRRDDFQKQAIHATAEHDPGTKFEYGGNHFHAFGAFLERRLEARGVSPSTAWEWYQRNLFEPVGMKVARIGRDRASHPNLPGGASASAREWAKFGEFVRRDGAVVDADGTVRQLLRPELLAQCFEPSPRNARYGLTWWLGPRGANGALPAVRMAAGLGKQRLYVIPSANLVVVRFAPLNSGNRGFSDEQLIARLLKAAGASPVDFPDIEAGMEARIRNDLSPDATSR